MSGTIGVVRGCELTQQNLAVIARKGKRIGTRKHIPAAPYSTIQNESLAAIELIKCITHPQRRNGRIGVGFRTNGQPTIVSQRRKRSQQRAKK